MSVSSYQKAVQHEAEDFVVDGIQRRLFVHEACFLTLTLVFRSLLSSGGQNIL